MKAKVHPAIAEAETYLNPPDDGLADLARNPEGSQIAGFFAGKTVFVTGAAGFVGKALIEKILWGCRGVKKVIVMLRHKRGKDASQRLQDMLQLPVFTRVRSDCPEQISKVVALNGDIDQPDFGLSEEDKTLLQAETDIVFHSAASLKLEAPLYDNLRTNTAGTKHALELASGMKNLKAFIHLSTAFCYPDFEYLDETVKPPPYCTPQDAVALTKSFDRETIQLMSPKLLEKHPNSYTFTKRLAENLVAAKFPELPVAIIRPSIVTPSYREPVPGWVDSLNGPIGVLVGAGKGVIRTMRCRADYTAEVVPLDYLVNSMLAVCMRVATDKCSDLPVYNTAAGDLRKSETWGEVLNQGRQVCDRFPFDNILWYPNGSMRTTQLSQNFWMFLTHILPAYFIDFLMLLFRQRRFMVRVQKRITLGLELLQFFTMRQWYFEAGRFTEVWQKMNHVDKKLFSFDPHAVDKEKYTTLCVLGARVYTMKEPLSTLPRARRLYKVYYAVDRIFGMLFYCFIAWYVVRFFAGKSEIDLGIKSSIPPMANAAEI